MKYLVGVFVYAVAFVGIGMAIEAIGVTNPPVFMAAGAIIGFLFGIVAGSGFLD